MTTLQYDDDDDEVGDDATLVCLYAAMLCNIVVLNIMMVMYDVRYINGICNGIQIV